MKTVAIHGSLFSALLLLSGTVFGSAQEDAAIVAALDTQYQAAVKANDYATMGRILADDFVVVLGTGEVFNKTDLIELARKGTCTYEHQEEIDNSQKVRVWGDTAVVTAKLWLKGACQGQVIERKLWFSDTYVRTKSGWKYVFGQGSIPLPNEK